MTPGSYSLGDQTLSGTDISYGLRLDGLSGNAGDNFLFSFEDGGALTGMTVSEPAGGNHDVRIFGNIWGGRVSSTGAYIDPAMWRLDFTYANVTEAGGWMTTQSPSGSSIGTLTALMTGDGFTAGDSFDLSNFRGWNLYDFQMGEEGGIVSAAGFLQSSEMQNLNNSGFLFTAEHMPEELVEVRKSSVPIPEPGSNVLFAVGLLVIALIYRQQVLSRP